MLPQVAATNADAREGTEAGAGADAQAGAMAAYLPKVITNPWPRIIVVGAAAMIIIGLCIGAHYLGVHEASRVRNGFAVDISEAGLDMSSISAIPVRLQPIDSSHAIESLSTYNCLLEIGSGANDLIFYNVNNHETFSVPASEVVVVGLSASKKCDSSRQAS